MARWWKEWYDRDNPEHQNRMTGAGEIDAAVSVHPTLVPAPVYLVSVCSFVFVFRSLEQVAACLEFYQTPILPSTRVTLGAADSWEVQRWWERLPLYLREEPKRRRVIEALSKALAEFSQQLM